MYVGFGVLLDFPMNALSVSLNDVVLATRFSSSHSLLQIFVRIGKIENII